MININDKFHIYTETILRCFYSIISFQFNGKRPLIDIVFFNLNF